MQEKVNEFFRRANADSALFVADGYFANTNFYYFTELSEKRQLTGYLVLRKGRKPLLLTDPREYSALRKHRSFTTKLYRDRKELAALLRENLHGRVGIDHQEISIARAKRLKKIVKRPLVDVSETLNTLRSVKTRSEIRKIREACKITEEIIAKVTRNVKIGQSERAIARKLDVAALSSSEGASFPTIVATGKNSATPHHIAGTTKMHKGNILLIDFGVVNDGYCSDLTRTFVLGNANVMQKHVYAVVYRAQREAMSRLMQGVKAHHVFHAANNIVREAFGRDMIHALGHGLGILTHDYPKGLRKDTKYPLRAGMVLTIEPGYYDSFGVRIEDDVVVTKKGYKLLSDAPQRLVSL